MKTITLKQLKSLLFYDPNSGNFKWRVRRKGVQVGAVAGGDDGEGYTRIKVMQRHYRASRLAWLYMTGRWPRYEVDHINGVRGDNRWKNLRDVSTSHNRQNQRHASSRSKSGLLGAFYNKHDKGWQAQIRVGDKNVRLYGFANAQEAHEGYLQAKRRLHPGCTI